MFEHAHGDASMPAITVDLESVDQSAPRVAPSLLIVEDEVIVAEDVRRRLEEMGYKITGVAGRGEQALALALRDHPDVILMDIGLKGTLDGIEAAQKILAEVDIPIVFASAYSDEATLRRVKTIDPYGFVLKPFDERELRTAIEIGLYKHQTERRLRESENHYRSLVELSSDGIATLDLNGVVLFCNSGKARMHGYSDPSEITGRHAFEFVAEEAHVRATALIARVKTGERLVDEPLTMKRSDGTRFPVEIASALIKGLPGDTPRVMCIEHDLTHRKQVQDDLQGVVEQLGLIVETMHDGVLVEDEARSVRLSNPSFCRTFALPGTGQIIGHSADEIMRECGRLMNDPAAFIQRTDALRAAAVAVANDMFAMQDGRTLQRDYIPLLSVDRVRGHVWQHHIRQ
jgi:PAS domain S-box-containing protein